MEASNPVMDTGEVSGDEDDGISSAFLSLREAEQNLEEALFQAKDKLSRTLSASRMQLSVLVKYAHYISTEHSVAAPLNWEQGDPRRPFPTDSEMRAGWLGRLNLLPPGSPIPAHLMQEAVIRDHQPADQQSNAYDFNIQKAPGGDGESADGVERSALERLLLSGAPPPPATAVDEVETMSTDSSGSSSTNSAD